jgi:hypothetical protein
MFSRRCLRRMPSSEMLRRVALVRTDVSKERIPSIIRETRLGELGVAANIVPSLLIPLILMLQAISSS